MKRDLRSLGCWGTFDLQAPVCVSLCDGGGGEALKQRRSVNDV